MPAPVDAASVLAAADVGATIGRTVVADRLMAMTGLRTGQLLERIARLLGVGDRADRRRCRRAPPCARPTRRSTVTLAGGLVTISGIGDDTDAEALWRAAVAAGEEHTTVIDVLRELFGPLTGVVLGGGWLNDPTIEAAVSRRFPTARRSRFGEPGAVGAACIAGISAGVLDGPFTESGRQEDR